MSARHLPRGEVGMLAPRHEESTHTGWAGGQAGTHRTGCAGGEAGLAVSPNAPPSPALDGRAVHRPQEAPVHRPQEAPAAGQPAGFGMPGPARHAQHAKAPILLKILCEEINWIHTIWGTEWNRISKPGSQGNSNCAS